MLRVQLSLAARWIRRCALIAVALLAAAPAYGQRVQFPTMLPDDSPFYTSSNSSPYGSPPPASYQQSLQPPVVTLDPYADPAAQPPALLPGADAMSPQPGVIAVPAHRLFHELKFTYAWLAGDSGNELGVDELDLNASFAFPFFFNPAPILITPGIRVNYFEGPPSEAEFGFPDLPPRTYDTYLEASWKPQISNCLSGDLAFRTGVYSDFENVTDDSLRFLGRGAAIVALSPRMALTGGVVYLNRNEVGLLPVAGFIYTPDEDTRWEAVFPNPRYSHRLTTIGNTEWWWHVRGEYGGGRWTIERAAGFDDDVDYNDLRLILGLDRLGFRGSVATFEVGYVFNREVVYDSGTPTFEPDDTVMVGASFAY